MIKKILFAIVGLLVIVGALAGIKALQIRAMIAQGSKFSPPPVVVSTSETRTEQWQERIPAVGSLSAVQGVTVAAELAGKVVEIAFDPGREVRAGDLLVRLDTSSEKARLPGAEANLELTRLNRDRYAKLLAKKFISQAEFDTADADYRQAVANLDDIRASIDKKTIRAPFAGQLGIRLVNLGQILSAGDSIVSLQTLDPIYVNFKLPQQQLGKLKPGYRVEVRSDALPGETFTGKISTINPEVDPVTRNVQVQATLQNHRKLLRPGMYVDLEVLQPVPRQVLAIPETAVLYAAYSNSVFVVEDQSAGKPGAKEQKGKVLRQQFVTLGEKRGDFVAVESGLKAGELVANSGVFKLRNGQAAVIDNTLSPEFKLAPKPENN